MAFLSYRGTGDKAWMPTPTFKKFHKYFSKMKENWNMHKHNRRVYFAVHRQPKQIRKGEKYPPIPKALHQITRKFLDERGFRCRKLE